jgi:hypothetical protein
MPQTRRGKSYELLVAQIERAFGEKDGRKIEHSKRLKHFITGTFREFDIVVTFLLGHHTFVTAIECKDHKRPVSVKEVEAFASKIESCPVNRGCLVAAKFTNNALVLAKAKKISCISLHRAANLDWLNTVYTLRTLHLHGLSVADDSDNDDDGIDASQLKFHGASDGAEIPISHLYKIAGKLLEVGWPGDERIRIARIRVKNQDGFIIRTESNLSCKMASFILIVKYNWTEAVKVFDVYNYEVDGEANGVASFDISIDLSPSEKQSGKVVFVEGDDGFAQVSVDPPSIPVRRAS